MTKFKKFLVAALMSGLVIGPQAFTAEETANTAPKPDVKSELVELVGKVRAKISEDKSSEAELADELKMFDTILTQHAGEKTDEVAEVLFMKAMLYKQILGQPSKAVEILKKVQEDYPTTKFKQIAQDAVVSIEMENRLALGATFPEFDVKDLDGKPLTVKGYKGKVVLVDFWATWCGPCVNELPNVLSTYEKFHGKGFEIIGISLDKDEDRLKEFIKNKNMPWRQYFDGKGWQNKLAAQFGVQSIPATFLLDGESKIVAKDLRGSALGTEVAKLLVK